MIDFLGVGAQKCGTSWAYACLYEHPEICAPIKEIHFFSRPRFEKGQAWYEAHFSSCKEGRQKGEFSTSYLYSEDAPLRIHSLYREAKIIAILRNPVARAVSQYRNSIKSGEITEATSFESFAKDEKSVLEQGLYSVQLERYFELFQREQMLVLVYEDIKKDPKAFMKRIYQFLGVDDTFESSMLNNEINVARTPKAVFVDRCMHRVSESLRSVGFDRLVHAIRKTGLPDLVRSRNTKEAKEIIADTTALKAYFKDDVQKLSNLLGRDFVSEWDIHQI
jgi:hypothetical protein